MSESEATGIDTRGIPSVCKCICDIVCAVLSVDFHTGAEIYSDACHIYILGTGAVCGEYTDRQPDGCIAYGTFGE